MGRWGYRLFEGDQDIDIACEVSDFIKDDDLRPVQLVFQTDMLAPPEARAFYQTPEYQVELAALIVRLREHLDSGIGNQFLAKYRAEEAAAASIYTKHDARYRLILVCALMMRAGARIKDDDLHHVRRLIPDINCNRDYATPLNDEGFRGPGRVQLEAALDNYEPGKPRDWQEPSCFACGKVQADTGKKPLQCSRCSVVPVWYCDKECQRSHWPIHKRACRPASQVRMLNV